MGKSGNLSTLSTDTAGQLDVLGHDGDPLGVDGTQVGVLKETHEVSLASLLQSHDSRALEPQVGLEVLGDLPDQTLEGQLADKQLSRLLVSPDLPQGDCARPVPVRLLHASGRRRRLAGSLRGQLFPRGLATGGFTCSLLGTSHVESSVTTDKFEPTPSEYILASHSLYLPIFLSPFTRANTMPASLLSPWLH